MADNLEDSIIVQGTKTLLSQNRVMVSAEFLHRKLNLYQGMLSYLSVILMRMVEIVTVNRRFTLTFRKKDVSLS